MDKTPRSRQYKLESVGDKLIISIPLPKQWFALLPWGGAVLVSLCMVVSGEPPFVAGFGVFGLLLIIWNFLRVQLVEVTDQSITLSHAILGMRMFPKRYLSENICDLRLSTDASLVLLAFDYGSATEVFGKGLGPAAAQEILSAIQRRFPRYQPGAVSPLAQPPGLLGQLPVPFSTLPKAVKPPSSRIRSEELGNLLRITIPSKKIWFVIIFFVFFLVVWSFGGFFAVRSLLRGDDTLFLLFWLSMWLVGELATIYHLGWILFGQEIIEVTPASLTIRRAIFGIGQAKKYTREHIGQIRLDVPGRVEPYSLAGEGVSLTKGQGMIAFTYKDKPVRLGIGIDEAEAKHLVARLRQYYPE